MAALPSVIALLQKIGEELYESSAYHIYDETYRGGNGHHHGEYNMHFWLSPIIARRIAKAIHDRLVNLMPKKQILDDNLQVFHKIMTINDKNIAKILAPVRSKRYFLFHDAYSYFETYYRLKPSRYFAANPEIQPGSQALHKI